MPRPPATPKRRPLGAQTIALRLREAQLRGILDGASEAIVTADDSQTIVMANAAAASMFRCRLDALIGRPLTDLLPPRLRDLHAAHVAAFGAAESTPRPMAGQREVVGLRASGEEFPIDAAISQAHVDGQRLYTVILRDLSEPRRMAAALHGSEQLLAATFNVSSVGMAHVHPDTRRFVAVNAAFCRLCGYDEAELIGMDIARLDHPADSPIAPRFDALLAGQTAESLRRRMVRKDGRTVWVELSGNVVRDGDGRPLRVVAVVQDITARHQAQEALQAREARQSFLVRLHDRLRTLDDPRAIGFEASRLLVERVGAARAGYAVDDGNGETITVVSHHTQGVPGIEGRYRHHDFGSAPLAALRQGRTVVRPDIAHDPSLTDAERQAHAELQLGATVNVPLLHGDRLGAIFFVHAAQARDWTPDEVTLFEEVAERISADIARARAEAEVRAAKAKLETALESMNDAVFIADADGRILDFNTAFATFHRFRSKRECVRTLADFAEVIEVAAADGTPVPLSQWVVPRALRGERASSVEYGLRRRDTGEQWTGSYSFAPIHDASGRVAGAVVTARDITEIRRVRSALQASHAELQRLFAALDRAQEQERLRIARELHDDMQQSLAAVLMEVTAARADLAAGATHTAQALGRIERLTLDALTSTRRIIFDLRPLVLEDLGLVAALQQLATQWAGRTGVTCRVDASGLPAADAARVTPALAACLYRVAQEALTNVARHARARSVQIDLAADAQGLLHLTVADDGIGLTPGRGAKPQAFGLLGMQERVRAVGGQLRLAGTPGDGTTVAADVPLPAAGAD